MAEKWDGAHGYFSRIGWLNQQTGGFKPPNSNHHEELAEKQQNQEIVGHLAGDLAGAVHSSDIEHGQKTGW